MAISSRFHTSTHDCVGAARFVESVSVRLACTEEEQIGGTTAILLVPGREPTTLTSQAWKVRSQVQAA